MDLTIVLRTCGSSGVISNQARRISGTDRQTLVLKCIKSIVESINNITANIPIKFFVLDDHSEPNFLARMENIISSCRVPYEIINLPDRSSEFKQPYNFSAWEQFRYGRDIAQDLLYMVEDDYLHCPTAIQDMIDAWGAFRSISDTSNVAIYPYDSTHNYRNINVPARLFYLNDRLWRTTTKSANTMFIHSDDIRKYWPLFDKLARDYGDGTSEDGTINRIWNNAVDHAGPVCLFSPIPSVAVHVSFDEPIKLKTELNDWRERYDSIDLADNNTDLKINHFYQNIQGWFDFHDFYTITVSEAKSGSHFVEVGAWKGRAQRSWL